MKSPSGFRGFSSFAAARASLLCGLATASIAHAQNTSGTTAGGAAIAGQEPQGNKSVYRRRVQVERGALELQASSGYQQGVGAMGGTSGSHVQDVAGVGAGADIGVGYRLSPYWMIGGYGNAAWFSGKGDAKSLHSYALGAQGQLHLRPRRSIDPWLGIGVGYRTFSFTPQGQSASTHQAIELPRVLLGVDYRVSHLFSVGPFLGAGLSLFLGEPRADQPDSSSTKVASFISLGVSARFDLLGEEDVRKSERASQ
jgi:outer membrane protein W